MQTDIDALTDQYLADQRQHRSGVPWVFLNMVTSIDGAIAVDGLSGGLGGPADLAVFRTLRGLADVIVVAAGTARSEQYRPARHSDATVDARRRRGQRDHTAIAVVTRSLDLDLNSELFTDGLDTTVVTIADADPDRLDATREVADVVVVGSGDVDLVAAVDALGRRHGQMVLAEGGPRLNGALMHADVVDELCVTVSPQVVGGSGSRMVVGDDHDPRRYALDRAVQVDDLLFTRYLRRG